MTPFLTCLFRYTNSPGRRQSLCYDGGGYGEKGVRMDRHGGKARIERGFCSLYLPVPLIEQARTLGQRTGLTRNQIVAMAVDDYLARHGQTMRDGDTAPPTSLYPVR